MECGTGTCCQGKRHTLVQELAWAGWGTLESTNDLVYKEAKKKTPDGRRHWLTVRTDKPAPFVNVHPHSINPTHPLRKQTKPQPPKTKTGSKTSRSLFQPREKPNATRETTSVVQGPELRHPMTCVMLLCQETFRNNRQPARPHIRGHDDLQQEARMFLGRHQAPRAPRDCPVHLLLSTPVHLHSPPSHVLCLVEFFNKNTHTCTRRSDRSVLPPNTCVLSHATTRS